MSYNPKQPRVPAGHGDHSGEWSPQDAPHVEIGGGGRAPRQGIWVSEVYYRGGEFLPEEFPAKAGSKGKKAARTFGHGNVSRIKIAKGVGGYWVKAQKAGESRETFMTKKPFDSADEARAFTQSFLAERAALANSEGLAAHPTDVEEEA